jgi:hypothetical protein
LAPRGTQLCQPAVIQNEPPYSQKDDHTFNQEKKEKKEEQVKNTTLN